MIVAASLWRGATGRRLAAALCLALAACDAAGPASEDSRGAASGFPVADRAHAPSPATVAEAQRDRAREAESVIAMAEIRPGMTVADIGAGEGYYTVRLAPRVGPHGRVLAEDIDPAVLRDLGDRVQRERLDNVSITLGGAADPNLPPASFDRVFLVDVYGYVGEPYAFLWHLRPTLRPGGEVVVFDRERPAREGGVSSALLQCEFAATGFRLRRFARKPELGGVFATFTVAGPRPDPSAIVPCRDPAHGSGLG